MLPKYCEIKQFFDQISNNYPEFKASKGWFEKFIWRNYKLQPRWRNNKEPERTRAIQPTKRSADIFHSDEQSPEEGTPKPFKFGTPGRSMVSIEESLIKGRNALLQINNKKMSLAGQSTEFQSKPNEAQTSGCKVALVNLSSVSEDDIAMNFPKQEKPAVEHKEIRRSRRKEVSPPRFRRPTPVSQNSQSKRSISRQ